MTNGTYFMKYGGSKIKHSEYLDAISEDLFKGQKLALAEVYKGEDFNFSWI